MITLSVGDVLERAWALTKKFGIKLALLFLLFYIVIGGLAYVATPTDQVVSLQPHTALSAEELLAGFTWANLVISILSFVFSIGIYTAALRMTRGSEENIQISDFVKPFTFYVKLFAMSLLVVIIVGTGLVLLVLPGIYLLVRLIWAQFYLIENPEASISESISASWKATEGKELTLLLIGIVAFFVSISGVVLCCIGFFYTLQIYVFALAVTFSLLFPVLRSPFPYTRGR